MTMDDFERLSGLVSRVRIVHQIPGRIRLKLTGTVSEQSVGHFKTYFSRFADALNDIPGIRSVRVNVLARSCTVEYDPDSIPDQAWNDLLEGVRSEGAFSLVTRLVRKYREVMEES